MWGPKAPHRFSGAPPPYPGVSGVSHPYPDLLFSREKSRQKHAREEKPFRWGFSPVTPSSATTQRGARVGTSSASLILTQASGFARRAAPPSSSANAPLVCLGAAPSGPFLPIPDGLTLFDGGSVFQDWGWGRIQRGGRSPLIGRCGGWSLGGGHSRKCPPPMRPFGDFSGEGKVTRGVGVEPPRKGYGGRRPRKGRGVGPGRPHGKRVCVPPTYVK